MLLMLFHYTVTTIVAVIMVATGVAKKLIREALFPEGLCTHDCIFVCSVVNQFRSYLSTVGLKV